MADAPASPPPAPAPAAVSPAAPAAATPPGNAHAPPAPAANPVDDKVDPREWGFVKRADGKWVKPLKTEGHVLEFDPTSQDSWNGVTTTKAAQRRMSEAAEVKQAWDNVLASFDADPVSTVRELARLRGKSVADIEKSIAAEVVRRERLSPEARELEEFKAREAARKAEDEERTKVETERQAAVMAQKWETGIRAAIDKSGMEPSDIVIAMMANAAMAERKRTRGPVDLMKIAKLVDDQLHHAHSKRLSRLSDDELLTRFDADMRKRLRALEAREAEKAAAAPPPAVPPSLGSEARPAAATAAPAKKQKPRTGAEKRAALAKVLESKGLNGGRTPIM